MKNRTLEQKKKIRAFIIIIPILLFTLVFIVGPAIYLVLLSFQNRTSTGQAILSFSARGGGLSLSEIFTFDNYKKIWDPVYKNIFKESFKFALASTFLVALIGYPFGYYMAKLSDKWKYRINSMLTIPFWVSSLLRLYGWKIIFQSNGILDKVLMALKITEAPLRLLYTYTATLVGTVYALLPFMIFAVYSSAEKLDWTLMEASRDLGATGFQAFRTVAFKLTLPGLLSGVILTFIPSMGLIFIAEILGGSKVILIGQKIVEQATVGKNQPFAAALSIVLMIFTGIFLYLYKRIFNVEALEGLS